MWNPLARAAALTTATMAAAVLVLPGAGVAAADRPKPPKPFTSTKVVIMKSVGQITLNGSYASAKKGFPGSTCTTDFGCTYTAPQGAYSVSFQLYAETKGGKTMVGRITVNAAQTKGTSALSALRTSKGIGMGSTLSAVKKAYPGGTASDAGAYYELDGKGEFETLFGFSHKHVDEIYLQAVHFG
jgi:hypothetical protein